MSFFRVLAACAALATVPALASASDWSLAKTDTYPYFDAQTTGVYRTQGVAVSGNEWVFSWQYGLERTDLNFNSLQRTGWVDTSTLTIHTGIPATLAAQGFDHIGDIDVANGIIYASLDSETGDYQNGHVALFNASDLSYTGKVYQLNGAPSNPHNDVASWVAVNAAAGLGYGKEWQNGSTINVYNLGDWSFSGTIAMDRSLKNIQGAKVFDGWLYMSAHDDTKSIYRMKLATGHVEELFQLPRTANAYNETEGIALRARADGSVEMVVEMIVEPNGNQLGTYVNVFHYELAPVPEPATWALMMAGLMVAGVAARRRA